MLTPVHRAQVFGMRRSGNHAIINWLMRNAPDGATGGLFYNNCRMGADPLQHFASLDVYDAEWQVIPSRRFPLELRMPKAGAKPMVVISYEDAMPRTAGQSQTASHGFDDKDFDSTILIYRSFLNWSASMLAKIQGNPGYGPIERMRIMFRAIKIYAEGLHRLSDPHVTGICYDDWTASGEARLAVLDQLGLSERDNALGEVQRFGGGSSFQKTALRADQLQSLSRADQMARDPEYQIMLWTVAHDLNFMERLMKHFALDAERLVALAESARTDIALKPLEVLS